jgi:hypothetical protein
MAVAFTCLANYVLLTGVDSTILGWWLWTPMGTSEHWTHVVPAYQPCYSKSCQIIKKNGSMKGKGTVAAQHEQYFQKKGNFNKPRTVFSRQLVTQLKAWQAALKEIILFMYYNENVYTGPLARSLRGEGLLMESKLFT